MTREYGCVARCFNLVQTMVRQHEPTRLAVRPYGENTDLAQLMARLFDLLLVVTYHGSRGWCGGTATWHGPGVVGTEATLRRPSRAPPSSPLRRPSSARLSSRRAWARRPAALPPFPAEFRGGPFERHLLWRRLLRQPLLRYGLGPRNQGLLVGRHLERPRLGAGLGGRRIRLERERRLRCARSQRRGSAAAWQGASISRRRW